VQSLFTHAAASVDSAVCVCRVMCCRSWQPRLVQLLASWNPAGRLRRFGCCTMRSWVEPAGWLWNYPRPLLLQTRWGGAIASSVCSVRAALAA
jgi:hypothetical protein